jgi:hypothetical protein
MIGHIICGVISGLSAWLIGKAYWAFRIEGGIFGTDKEINKKIAAGAKLIKKEAKVIGKVAEKSLDNNPLYSKDRNAPSEKRKLYSKDPNENT